MLTTSAWLAARMTERYGLPPGHAVSVGCGTEALVVTTPQERDYASNKLLFVGVEFERKGGRTLLEAFAKVRSVVPDAELHIVGPHDRPFREAPPGVTWHGYLDRADDQDAAKLTEFYRDCSLFVLPSLYEPFGIAPIEAMSNGLPAVVTGRWALAENVREGIDGAHVEPGDTAGLAQTITDLMTSPETLARMGADAAATPARQSWDDVAARIVSVFRTIEASSAEQPDRVPRRAKERAFV